MTPQEQADGNRVVAEAMGGVEFAEKVNGVVSLWRFPGNSIAQSFDLFAPTPDGALAREQARKFIVGKRFRFMTGTDKKGLFCESWHPTLDTEWFYGDMEEAEVLAIISACRRLREDGK